MGEQPYVYREENREGDRGVAELTMHIAWDDRVFMRFRIRCEVVPGEECKTTRTIQKSNHPSAGCPTRGVAKACQVSVRIQREDTPLESTPVSRCERMLSAHRRRTCRKSARRGGSGLSPWSCRRSTSGQNSCS